MLLLGACQISLSDCLFGQGYQALALLVGL
jgi:hypothetical protein